MTTKTEFAHIVCTPGVLGGEPHIEGHRIRVRDIVAARDIGAQTPEEIAASVFPSLSLGEVYAALAYYEDHREQILTAERDSSEFVEQFLKENGRRIHDLRPATE